MARPTVLLVSPLGGCVSGVEAVTRSILASALAKEWDLHHLDTATARRNQQRGLPTPFGVYRMARLVADLAEMVQVVQPRAAIIQLAQSRGGFLKFALLASVCFRHRVRVVARFGGGSFDRFVTWVDPVSRTLIKRVLTRCAAVLVEAECLQGQFANILPPEKIRWAHLGLDPDPYLFPLRIRSPQRLLYVGHVSRAKGGTDLLEAMEIVREKKPNLTLTMLGEPLQKERNVVHIKEDGQAWRRVKAGQAGVTAPGIVVGPERLAAFRDSDIFVFPSHSEGMPTAVLEAMASGLPMVCTPVGALPEILTDGVHCDFVPVGKPRELARTILSLANHSNRFRRQAMSLENREAVEKRLTLEAMSEGFKRAIGDIVEGK